MAVLAPQPKAQFFDANGSPLVGGKVYTYAAGTTTPLATYTDASAATPNTNPVILDSRGEEYLCAVVGDGHRASAGYVAQLDWRSGQARQLVDFKT